MVKSSAGVQNKICCPVPRLGLALWKYLIGISLTCWKERISEGTFRVFTGWLIWGQNSWLFLPTPDRITPQYPHFLIIKSFIKTSNSCLLGYHSHDDPIFYLGDYQQNDELVNYKSYIFAMDNFGFNLSEMVINEEFEQVFYKLFLPWLKNFLDLNCLECSRIKNFSKFITKCLHHGRRKFWISIVWNAPK